MNLPRLSLLFLALVFSLCGLPSLTAQTLEFRVLSWSGAPANLHLARSAGAEPILLKAAEDVLSPVYRVQGASPLRLFGSPADAASPEAEPLAVIPQPAGLVRAILVLAPNPAAAGSYVGMWLDDSPEARPDDSITLHNLSSSPVALRIGSEQARLDSRQHHTYRFSASERSVMIQAAVPRGDQWERIVSDPQPVKRGFRILVILRDGRRQAGGEISALDRVTFYDYRKPQN